MVEEIDSVDNCLIGALLDVKEGVDEGCVEWGMRRKWG